MSTIGFFSLGAQTALNEDISRFLGAPLVISSQRQLPDQWWQSPNHSLAITKPALTASFTYGAIGKAGYHSIALKAVSNNYPQQDPIILSITSGELQQQYSATAKDLKPSEVWLGARAMFELGVKQGDRIQLGQHFFTVAAEIVFEPDRLTQLQHILPRVMIGIDDLASLGLDINNGRGEFRYLFNDKQTTLDQLEQKLPLLLSQDHKILKPNAGGHPFSRMAQRSEKLLGLVMVLIMLMCGSAAALLASKAMKQFILPATILRCMGINKRVFQRTMMMQLILLAVSSSIIGTFFGWIIQPLFQALLQPHLMIADNVFNLRIPIMTLAITLLTIFSFVYPRLQALGNVAIVSVLRGQLIVKKSLWIAPLSALLAVIALLWYNTDNTTLTVYLSIGVITVVVLSVSVGWLISKLTAQFHHLSRGTLKIVLRSLGRNPKKHIAPMATIALAVMAFLMINTLRGSFIDSFHIQSLNQDGNFLFSRLPQEHQQSFIKFSDTNNLTIKGMYPTVSALLVSINDLPLDQAIKQESDSREELRSPVRLSWSKKIPTNNRMLTGHWPQNAKDGVSIEAEAMSDLGLKIGDKLVFKINDKFLTTTISSRREFISGGSRIMFWFMFSPETLKDFSHNYMGGININSSHLNEGGLSIISKLNSTYPQVLFTNLQHLMQRVTDIMNALMKIVSGLLIVLLIAAFTVLLASAFVSSNEYQFNLMRAMGLTKGRLYLMNIMQQGLIGLVSCLVGIIGAQLISGVIFDQMFAMPYQADLVQNISITIVTTICFVLFGLFLSMRISKKPILINVN